MSYQTSGIQESLEAARKEADKWKSLAAEFVKAATGLSYGTDWNNGTHAKLHGYRQKLLDVLAKAREAGL